MQDNIGPVSRGQSCLQGNKIKLYPLNNTHTTTTSSLCQCFDSHPSLRHVWKQHYLSRVRDVICSERHRPWATLHNVDLLSINKLYCIWTVQRHLLTCRLLRNRFESNVYTNIGSQIFFFIISLGCLYNFLISFVLFFYNSSSDELFQYACLEKTKWKCSRSKTQ